MSHVASKALLASLGITDAAVIGRIANAPDVGGTSGGRTPEEDIARRAGAGL